MCHRERERREKSQSAPRSLNTVNIGRFDFSFFKFRELSNVVTQSCLTVVPCSVSRKNRKRLCIIFLRGNYIRFDPRPRRSCVGLSYLILSFATVVVANRCFESLFSLSFLSFPFPPRQKKRTTVFEETRWRIKRVDLSK